jgi:hypothetical protein
MISASTVESSLIKIHDEQKVDIGGQLIPLLETQGQSSDYQECRSGERASWRVVSI